MNATVPSQLTVGDTWKVSFDLPDYPAPTWALTVHFANSAGKFEITATGSGSEFTGSKSYTDTAAIAAGRYRWAARVTDGNEVFTVATGYAEVLPDPTTAHDTRTWERKLLDAVEATLLGRATRDEMAITINGRTLSRIEPKDLEDLRDRLRAEVQAQEMGAKAGLGRDIRVRFNRV